MYLSGRLYTMAMHPCPKYRPSFTDGNGHHTPSVIYLCMLVLVMPPTGLYMKVSSDAVSKLIHNETALSRKSVGP